MPEPRHVRMKHKELGEWNCPRSYVKHAEANGWSVVGAGDEDPPDERPQGQPFGPLRSPEGSGDEDHPNSSGE